MPRSSSQAFPAVLALLLALVPLGAARAEGPPAAPGLPQGPSPFQFEVEEITLKLRDGVVLHDKFEREGGLRPLEVAGRKLAAGEGPEYHVDLGRISAANVRDGVLRINQDVTSNLWHGPQGNYGHTLHRHDSFVAMLTMPVNKDGGLTFLGREAYGLEFSVRLRGPQLQGFEKLKIGLMDMEAFSSVAAISVGQLPLPSSPSRDGGASEDTDILKLASQPSIVLGCVEEPRVKGEIVLDHAKIESFDQIENLEMVLRVGTEGQLSGLARIKVGGKVKEVELTPQIREPREFFAARSTLPADIKLAATLFVETLPRLEVLRVYPREVAVQDLGADKVRFRIEGFGFGPDSRVEIVPEGAQGEPVRADAIHRQKAAGLPEGTVLLADIGLPARVGSYSVRVTTGGQSLVFEKAVRVFSPAATGAAGAGASTTSRQVP